MLFNIFSFINVAEFETDFIRAAEDWSPDITVKEQVCLTRGHGMVLFIAQPVKSV